YGRQKGGGRARHGSRRANIFVGGSVAHGPRVRDHGHDLPKKVRKLALKHALSAKAGARELIVLDDAALADDQAKTKVLKEALGKLDLAPALIIAGAEVDANFARAARNLPQVDVLPVQGINVYDVLRRDTLVLTKAAVDALHARFNGAAGAGQGDAS
ncbi:MAG: 50S ribosomal protein L4, partial [Caulobacterales bacterium]|nr:50S ribosomal protein L4 [Caulobacterales bacterium]